MFGFVDFRFYFIKTENATEISSHRLEIKMNSFLFVFGCDRKRKCPRMIMIIIVLHFRVKKKGIIALMRAKQKDEQACTRK